MFQSACHSYYTSVHDHNAGIIDGMKLYNTDLMWPIVAWLLNQASWKSNCSLKRYLLGQRHRH